MNSKDSIFNPKLIPKPTLRNATKMDVNDTHSTQLTRIIADEIHKHGPINFATFMELALYHQQYGYYMTQTPKLGHAGDFTTAPELGNIFATCLANQIKEFITKDSLRLQLQQGKFNNAFNLQDAYNFQDNNYELQILEFGAGSGKLAADLLTTLSSMGITINKYTIVEISPYLAKVQQQTVTKLQQQHNIKTEFSWEQDLTNLPDNFVGIVIANELFDAMPVHCIEVTTNSTATNSSTQDLQINELMVTTTPDFTWTKMPATDAIKSAVVTEILPTLQQSELFSKFPFTYKTEINLNFNNFFATLSKKIKKGIFLFFDYGFNASQYYHHDRNTGTILCYKQHQLSQDPLHAPGTQDITAHVNFSALKRAAIANGLEFINYTTLANFLLGCNLIDVVEQQQNAAYNSNAIDKSAELDTIVSEVNILTSPNEMGESIKVIAFSKGITTIKINDTNVRGTHINDYANVDAAGWEQFQGFSFKNLHLE